MTCDCPWFHEAIYFAACEHVFQWCRENLISQTCSDHPNAESLKKFLGYFEVARTVRRDDRLLFLDFVSKELRSHTAGSSSKRPNFSETPEFLRSFALPGGRKPLSALSKWVLVTNQGRPWTPFDRFVCAALGIRGRGDAKFLDFYSRLADSKWEEVCSAIDRVVVPNHGFSIARVFDKFLFLAGSERLGRDGWIEFRCHANALCEAGRRRACELSKATLASPEAVALLEGLIGDDARKALERAHERHASAPRRGGGA